MNVSFDEVRKRLGEPDYKEKVISDNQTSWEILNAVMQNDRDRGGDYKKISHLFDGGTVRQISKRVYDFLIKNITKHTESGELQTTRSPAMFMKMRNGDCKHFSNFVGGVLNALDIPFVYRFTSYDNDKDPTHVYVVAFDEGGNEIVIDVIAGKNGAPFDYEQPYTYKYDKRPMALKQISGYTQGRYLPAVAPYYNVRHANTIGSWISRAWDWVKKAASNVASAVVNVAQDAWGVTKTVAAAPSRNAFLLLVKANVFNLKTRMRQANQKDPGKVKSMWKKFGGDYSALNSAMSGLPLIGELSVSAAIAAATPILVTVVALLKDIGISPLDQGGSSSIPSGSGVSVSAPGGSVLENGNLLLSSGGGADDENFFEKNKTAIVVTGVILAAGIAYMATREKERAT